MLSKENTSNNNYNNENKKMEILTGNKVKIMTRKIVAIMKIAVKKHKE